MKDIGDSIALQLEASPIYVPLPRKRIDQRLESGNIDVVCYSSPKWTDKPERFYWSMTILPQIERVVTRYGAQMPATTDEFLGKRVSLQLGYHYHSIQPLFDTGRATRINETSVSLMFKAVCATSEMVWITEDQDRWPSHLTSCVARSSSKKLFRTVPAR